MDHMPIRGGTPVRGQQPVQRAAAAPPPPPVDPPKPAEPVRHVRHTSSEKPKKSKSKIIKIVVAALVAILILVVLVVAIKYFSPSGANANSGIDDSKYQAVFFTNGQVYFGDLVEQNSQYMKLTGVFYLQTQGSENDSENPQDAADQQESGVQLIKLGDEIHGPEDEMIISRDQILFFENLKSDGKVTQSIDKYKESN